MTLFGHLDTWLLLLAIGLGVGALILIVDAIAEWREGK